MKTQHLIPILFLAAFCTASAQTGIINKDLSFFAMYGHAIPQTNAMEDLGLPKSQEFYQEYEEDLRIHVIVADGSTFSNVVAVLGGDYIAVTNNVGYLPPGVTNLYWADFMCVLPGDTNLTEVIFRVENDSVHWMPHATSTIQFPPHQKHVSASQ
jgi:hypothetical protein